MENEQEVVSQKNFKLSALGKALAFLVMEVLAILGFSLGNSMIFYSIVGVVLLVISIIITRKQINSDGISTFAFFLFPAIVYGILSALSYLRVDPYFDLQGLTVIFVPIGVAAFAAMGYFLSLVKEFKIKYALIVIYSSIALLVLINLIATFIDFGFFHTIVFKGKYLFYDGKISNAGIQDMAMGLTGFKMNVISIRYFSLFPSVLLSAFVPLFFIPFKENKKLFILYLIFGSIGLLSLIFTPNKWTLVSDVLVVTTLALVVLAIKFKFGKKFKITLIAAGALAGILLIVVAINSQSASNGVVDGVKNLIANNSLLNRLFNDNGLIAPIRCALDGLFTTDRILGAPINQYTVVYKEGLLVTGSWVFDSIYASGLFGLGFLIFVLVIGIRGMLAYLRKCDDGMGEKTAIFAFVFAFFAYTLVNFDMTPFVFKDTIMPIYQNGLFLIAIFLMSYCYAKANCFNKVETKKEETEEAKEENIIVEEDYKNEEISL